MSKLKTKQQIQAGADRTGTGERDDDGGKEATLRDIGEVDDDSSSFGSAEEEEEEEWANLGKRPPRVRKATECFLNAFRNGNTFSLAMHSSS